MTKQNEKNIQVLTPFKFCLSQPNIQVSLIGMPGCLKTSVGKILAQDLKIQFIDTDEYIQDLTKKTVSQIFDIHGQDYFRQLEYRAILELYSKKNIVLTTGGGLVLSSTCMDYLKDFVIIWLFSSREKIIERLKNDQTRPLLVGDKEQKLTDMLKQRISLYKKYADIAVDNTNLTAQQTVDLILSV
jgi:shikimate kinase